MQIAQLEAAHIALLCAIPTVIDEYKRKSEGRSLVFKVVHKLTMSEIHGAKSCESDMTPK